METIKDSITGLLIRSIDYKDSSKIIYILTNSGIKSIISKGVKKQTSKLKSDLLLYNYGQFYISKSKTPILTDVVVLNRYNNLKENINKYMNVGKIINVLFHENYENNKIYSLALKTIDYINNSDEEYYYNLFMLKNLYFLGINPNFKCICGNNKDYIGFNIKEGQSVCINCNKAYDIDKDLLNNIFDMYYSKLEDKLDVDILKINKFLIDYYTNHSLIKLL